MQRVIIVTGGGSGIGRAIAAHFAENKEQVIITGRTKAKLKRTADEIGAAYKTADSGQREQVAALVDWVMVEFGRIDVVVNNAGLVRGAGADTPLDEAERAWDAEMDANLKGSFLMAVACAPHLNRPGGRIINMSSIAAYTGGSRGGVLGYAAAKAGLHGLTVALARDLSADGITVNAIVPGLIDQTDFFGGPLPQERLDSIAAQIPAGRPGHPADIAHTVAFLASPGAAYITGEIINVNGGWLFGR